MREDLHRKKKHRDQCKHARERTFACLGAGRTALTGPATGCCLLLLRLLRPRLWCLRLVSAAGENCACAAARMASGGALRRAGSALWTSLTLRRLSTLDARPGELYAMRCNGERSSAPLSMAMRCVWLYEAVDHARSISVAWYLSYSFECSFLHCTFMAFLLHAKYSKVFILRATGAALSQQCVPRIVSPLFSLFLWCIALSSRLQPCLTTSTTVMIAMERRSQDTHRTATRSRSAEERTAAERAAEQHGCALQTERAESLCMTARCTPAAVRPLPAAQDAAARKLWRGASAPRCADRSRGALTLAFALLPAFLPLFSLLRCAPSLPACWQTTSKRPAKLAPKTTK